MTHKVKPSYRKPDHCDELEVRILVRDGMCRLHRGQSNIRSFKDRIYASNLSLSLANYSLAIWEETIYAMTELLNLVAFWIFPVYLRVFS